MSSIPLRHRLRNRPALFVGRKTEVARLQKTIARGPVSIVCGPGGYGKTALVLATLHEKLADRIASALHVALDAEAGVDARVETVRALALAEGWQISWPGLLADPEALVATAIDLAERARRVIVIDDLHHANPETARELIIQFARYARTSRLICTTRVDPEVDEIVAQTITLEPMSERDLSKLARDLVPSARRASVSNAVRLAGGSPWRLQQALSGALSEASDGSVDVLAGLPDEARLLLCALAVLERPLPLEALAPLGPLPDGELVERLEQRGLIERAAGGLRLDHLTSDQLSEDADARSALAIRVAGALDASEDPVAQLEAARLWLASGRIDSALALLDRAGRALLESGAAPELWRMLEPIKDSRLTLWRMRVAVQLGERRALDTIGEIPPRGSAQDVLAWAGAMLARGAIDEALDTADRVASEAPEARLRFDATILAVRASLARADLGAVRSRLLASEPVDGPSESLKNAISAVVAAHAGDPELALEWTAHAPERLAELPFDARLEVSRWIAGALETNGRPADAAYALNAMLQELGPRALHLVHGRLAMCLSAIADTECGHLDLARATIERLEPFAAGVLGPSLEYASIDLGIASGALVGLGQRLDGLLASSLASRQASHYFAAARLDLQLRALRARPMGDYPGLDELEPPSPAYGGLVELRRRALALLSGANVPAPELESEHAEVRIVSGTVDALSQLGSGDVRAALERARATVSLAKGHGFAVYEAEALELGLVALLMLERRHELARGAEELSALGRRMGSPRFGEEAAFWARAARPELDCPELFERLARLVDVAPVAARRARALLGDEAKLDRLDRLVIETLRARPGFRAPELVTSGEAGSRTWGLDERRRAVWSDDGSLIELSRRDVPWRLLSILADAGGHADKESLVVQVWAPKSYHPLAHDNRLRLAVRELRRAIETDLSKPERVLTTEQGYALGGRVRRLRSAPP